ncbi:Kelch-like protein 17 [Amycolatopsis balhimycina DSM 5908]|uniref:Kelch-like protein 17 n=1 Tax=Amycolatopsis balhimycina DSM 5908 TaxID=1081091 RepID=A0A428WDR4_AMYBA|nr:kelch repeat-containing protein [Amycolatopsis balhimycina]RSM41196.1 Kelch-like protein 17 [Amycolatopsis balhimycina DSM 5908]
MSSPTIAATGTWTAAGTLPSPAAWYGRHDGAVLLTGGTDKVLVIGGADGSATAAGRTAVYDAAAKTWTAAAAMQVTRRLYTATVLDGGSVLVAGGITGSRQFPSPGLNTVELYDPAQDAWTTAAPMKHARWGHSAVLVGGKVLVAGGFAVRSGQSELALAGAELYDPVAKTWTEVGPMTDPRGGHAAVLLKNGKVLVTGGAVPVGKGTDTDLAYCELYDPAQKTWSVTGSMTAARAGHQATALDGGAAVLVTGGRAPGGRGDGTFDPFSRAAAELYDQATGTWSPVDDLPGGRVHHRAVALGPDQALVVGGTGDVHDDAGYESAAIFDRATKKWTTAGGLATGRWAFAAVALSGGRAMVAGGVARSGAAAASAGAEELTGTAEIFATAATP